ncbi:MAG TPA: DNA-deoxyinosine glycosylase [Candidatus Fimenecus stercoravium]|nr:DNA-deoxyinosine glycosylase [Candidatus Fimenecus stercoravium]
MTRNISAPERLSHPFPALYDQNSRVLILGSFPSVKSRAQNFFYGHPQNRFWRVISALVGEPTPETIPEKRRLVLAHHFALWDVIASCEITGSSDASIQNAVPNDVTPILAHSQITRVFTNGKTAGKLYDRYLLPKTGITAQCLPSTSPANAAWTYERLLEAWQAVLPQEK